MECGGNLYDAVSLAVKGALFSTTLPKVTAALMDGGNIDLQLSEDPYDSVRLKTESIPIFITICKIGEYCIVDPSAEEEVCSSASLVVGVSNRENKGELSLDDVNEIPLQTLKCSFLLQFTLQISARVGLDHFTWKH